MSTKEIRICSEDQRVLVQDGQAFAEAPFPLDKEEAWMIERDRFFIVQTTRAGYADVQVTVTEKEPDVDTGAYERSQKATLMVSGAGLHVSSVRDETPESPVMELAKGNYNVLVGSRNYRSVQEAPKDEPELLDVFLWPVG